MKNFNLSRMFILLFFTSVTLMSCSTDDDGEEENGSGNANYDGTEINLDQGYIVDYGEYEGLYNFDITLLSDDFEIDIANENIEGNGEMVYFEMWTEQSSGLKNGTYTLSNGESDFGLTYAEFAMDFNPNEDEEEGGSYLESTVAEVTVNKSGSTYTLDFELTFENGKSLTGRYVGNLIEIGDY